MPGAVRPNTLRDDQRGASVVENVILVAAILGLLLGGWTIFGGHIRASLQCQGSLVANLHGGYTCARSGGAAQGSLPAAGSAAVAQNSVPPRPLCTRENGCMCFVAGTPVVTSLGLLPIEAVTPGLLVLTQPEAGGRPEWRPVVQTFVNRSRALLHLTFVDQDGRSETLTMTGNHPFYVVGAGWLEARALEPGADQVVDADGRTVNLIRAETSPEHKLVYNFEVADDHTYFVGKLRIWVHNQALAVDTPITFVLPGGVQVIGHVIRVNRDGTVQVRVQGANGRPLYTTLDQNGRPPPGGAVLRPPRPLPQIPPQDPQAQLAPPPYDDSIPAAHVPVHNQVQEPPPPYSQIPAGQVPGTTVGPATRPPRPLPQPPIAAQPVTTVGPAARPPRPLPQVPPPPSIPVAAPVPVPNQAQQPPPPYGQIPAGQLPGTTVAPAVSPPRPLPQVPPPPNGSIPVAAPVPVPNQAQQSPPRYGQFPAGQLPGTTVGPAARPPRPLPQLPSPPSDSVPAAVPLPVPSHTQQPPPPDDDGIPAAHVLEPTQPQSPSTTESFPGSWADDVQPEPLSWLALRILHRHGDPIGRIARLTIPGRLPQQVVATVVARYPNHTYGVRWESGNGTVTGVIDGRGEVTVVDHIGEVGPGPLPVAAATPVAQPSNNNAAGTSNQVTTTPAAGPPVATLTFMTTIGHVSPIDTLRTQRTGHSFINIHFHRPADIPAGWQQVYPQHYALLRADRYYLGAFQQVDPLGIEFRTVPGQVRVEPDGYWNNTDRIAQAAGALRYDLTAQQVAQVIEYVNRTEFGDFNICTQNCTDWALGAVRASGNRPPAARFGVMNMPSVAFQTIRRAEAAGNPAAQTLPLVTEPLLDGPGGTPRRDPLGLLTRVAINFPPDVVRIDRPPASEFEEEQPLSYRPPVLSANSWSNPNSVRNIFGNDSETGHNPVGGSHGAGPSGAGAITISGPALNDEASLPSNEGDCG